MDRKSVAKQLRAEAAQLISAAELIEGSGKQRGRKPMSEETKAKMAEAQKRRWGKKAAKKRPAKKAEKPTE